VEGGDLGNFYGKRFAGFDASGKWLFYKADGHTKVPLTQVTDADKTVIGKRHSKYYYALITALSIKISACVSSSAAVRTIKFLNTLALSYGNRTYLPGNVLNSAFTKYAQLNDTYQYSDFYSNPAAFLKLDNITFGYRFDLKTNVYPQPLYICQRRQPRHHYEVYGNDPDFVNDTGLGPSVDSRGPYPSTRQFTAGLNIDFNIKHFTTCNTCL